MCVCLNANVMCVCADSCLLCLPDASGMLLLIKSVQTFAGVTS